MFIEDKKDKVFIPQTQNTITANDYNQIKNEIQNAIELAGMTPEKDVIQFPQALKTLTQQSGAEEVAKIEAAGQEQLDAINTAGQTQTAAVNEAGNTQTEAVNAAGETQINNINTAGAQAVQDAQDAANTATSKAAEAAGSATEAAGSASAAASSASEASGSASTATTQASNAADSAALAQKWAVQTDGAVSGGEYSAKYHAQQAASSALAASTAKTAAQTAQSEAETAKTQAASSASAAANSASAASQSAQECQDLADTLGNPAKSDLSNVTDIAASSAVQTALNGKAATDLSNGTKATQTNINNIMPDAMDYVVDSYSDDAGNWYRVYKSGWIEQGGLTIFATSGTSVTFLKPFLNDAYSITTGAYSNDIYTKSLNIYNKTATAFVGNATTDGGGTVQTPVSWYACGQGA